MVRQEWAGRPILYYEETDSTNVRAREMSQELSGTLFVADKQSAGKGRRGRCWESPAGVNLYFTLLLKPDFTPDTAAMVTLVMGLAVAESIREFCGLDAYIKWPNDVVVNGKKVCGILTELELQGNAIHHLAVGVGINVCRQEFAQEIAATATSIEQELGSPVDRRDLLEQVMKRFDLYYGRFVQDGDLGGLQECYNKILVNRDREVRVLDPKGEYTGMAKGITQTGELLVENTNGVVEKVYAGEVSVRGIYGYI